MPETNPIVGAKATIEPWVPAILVDPVTKLPVPLDHFIEAQGVRDARVALPNTYGFTKWRDGQEEYEEWASEGGAGGDIDYQAYVSEIEFNRATYKHIRMAGRVLDVGGGAGIVREYLPPDTEFISVDPFVDCIERLPKAKIRAYGCLSRPVNFIGACAEFLPFSSNSFDWVHMRSMIDHVQVPDLAMIEASRVLKAGGRLVVGLYVIGGKSGQSSPLRRIRTLARQTLGLMGIKRYQDHHVWHPTFVQLIKLIEDHKFRVEDTYWQPGYNESVVYITAAKI